MFDLSYTFDQMCELLHPQLLIKNKPAIFIWHSALVVLNKYWPKLSWINYKLLSCHQIILQLKHKHNIMGAVYICVWPTGSYRVNTSKKEVEKDSRYLKKTCWVFPPLNTAEKDFNSLVVDYNPYKYIVYPENRLLVILVSTHPDPLQHLACDQ